MIQRAVIDTNVFVSALWTNNLASPPLRIYNSVIERKIIPLYCDEIIAEYNEVLHRAKFHFDEDIVDSVVQLVKNYGEKVSAIDCSETFPDPDDRVFYCTALAAQDDGAVLVTGNKRHFPPAGFILTPAEFVASHLS